MSVLEEMKKQRRCVVLGPYIHPVAVRSKIRFEHNSAHDDHHARVRRVLTKHNHTARVCICTCTHCPRRLQLSSSRLHRRLRARTPTTLQHHHFHLLHFVAMAPKPASTAGKAPASTASKAPAKTTADKAAKKTAKKTAPADGDKKKKRKVRKETYSSYIYKGAFS